MKRSKFTEEQIAFALHQADTGTSVEEVCRKIGISQATFYAWKKKYAGVGVAELRRMR
jgi:putative transposase